MFEIKEFLLKNLNDSIELKSNIVAYCPFCNHHKRKLSIDYISGKYQCWVCHTKGRTLFSLFNRLKIDYSEIKDSLFKQKSLNYTEYTSELNHVSLPSEYIRISFNDSITEKIVLNYLYSRHVTKEEILFNEIGYCLKGDYKGKIIIPSFDSKNRLNYFFARDFIKKPGMNQLPDNINKDIIFFENHINYELPVFLVEGGFDALSIKHNVIPLLGNTMNKYLLNQLIVNTPPKIYVILDKDAFDKSLKILKTLLNYCVDSEIYIVLLNEKDPSVLGYEKIWELIKNNARVVDEYEIMKLKLRK